MTLLDAGQYTQAELAEIHVGTTPILDSVKWFSEHCKEIGSLGLNWNSAGSYRRYTACTAEWAIELGIEPEQVEQLIFRRS